MEKTPFKKKKKKTCVDIDWTTFSNFEFTPHSITNTIRNT